MQLISPQSARNILRAYPFKKGRSELKKALSCVFPQDQPCLIETAAGIRLYLDNYRSNARIFWWFEEQEPALQFYIRRYLPAGGHVLDIGAAYGIVGLLAARLKSAQVKLVEANPATVAILKETLRHNPEISGLCELIGQPCALGPVDSRYVDKPGITVEKIIRDAGWDHVDLLKIDIDGPDFEVLESTEKYLRPEFIEAIYIETEVANPSDIVKVAELGYVAYATKRTHLPELRLLGVNQTENFHYQALDLNLVTGKMPSNVLFLNKERPLHEHMKRWCG